MINIENGNQEGQSFFEADVPIQAKTAEEEPVQAMEEEEALQAESMVEEEAMQAKEEKEA